MSWFQTSFSAATSGLASTLNNISGQLTDLTQDVLQEGVQSSFLVEDDGDIGEASLDEAIAASRAKNRSSTNPDIGDDVTPRKEIPLAEPAVLALDGAKGDALSLDEFAQVGVLDILIVSIDAS